MDNMPTLTRELARIFQRIFAAAVYRVTDEEASLGVQLESLRLSTFSQNSTDCIVDTHAVMHNPSVGLFIRTAQQK